MSIPAEESGGKHYLRDRYEFTSTRADLDLDPEAGVEGWDGDQCGTIPYISGGRFMEIRSAVSSRYNDRWPRYDRAAAPVPYVSLGVPPSTTYASPRHVRICGSLAGAPLNMEESGEITIRRVRSGLRTRISLSCKLLSLRGLLSLPVQGLTNPGNTVNSISVHDWRNLHDTFEFLSCPRECTVRDRLSMLDQIMMSPRNEDIVRF